MKTFILFLPLSLCASTLVAQNQQSSALPLPDGVNSVTSYDPQNSIIAAYTGEDGRLHYEVIPLRHVYSGGIARIFGGAVIPTQSMVTPVPPNTGGLNMGTNAPFFYTPRPGGGMSSGAYGGGVPSIRYPTAPVQGNTQPLNPSQPRR
ncbi:MAG: hypothetical protein AUJ92_12115 [Armatimonadetes bacterium CG2_30_59_28]|nr:hypothetical protein [Armatimonadota bacterium]OIO93583.1 MAG: hypothetical protein AUJ92_12115 [Armatimonadetes bacterium CG2_30_59_28]PIU65820.1 MAG: hypothetical protein COS85_07305 [Armatimonadetes bacterium CG07_land_8_20_14_0_80_59_28]PIX42372.1 MAG: hypothetical protein COZ56_09530 [Armatimonadetes bacterium CG_4_8_14_3_um_filter_58_9]PIY49324.1 MAG: hypothetical protein COZ05_00735 [Armatimonadetes bacterium CG_4_10_14_3_um_filter_59_10]